MNDVLSGYDIWKDVTGYVGIYKVNMFSEIKSIDHYVTHSDGKIRLQKGRLLKTSISKKGYVEVNLSKSGKRFHTGIHRISAIEFVINPLSLPEVNHNDGNKLNNHVSNFSWVTPKQNSIHACRLGLNNPNYGEKHHNCRLTNNEIIEIKNKIKKGLRCCDIAKQYNLSRSAISQIKKGVTYKNI